MYFHAFNFQEQLRANFVGTKFWDKLVNTVKQRQVEELNKEKNREINDKLEEIKEKIEGDQEEFEREHLNLLRDRMKERKKEKGSLRMRMLELKGDDLFYVGNFKERDNGELSSVLSFQDNSLVEF